MIKNTSDSDLLIGLIIKGMEEIKGKNINLLDLRNIENAFCDYFVICDGNSNTQVNAITNSISKIVSKEIMEKPYQIEGVENAEWILMDYINVVVHIFQKHKREYYDVENLWGDAKITEIETSY
ncbi:MAG: ribosome silencing factor [Formosa sp.]|nr:ribosome silencing factor [Formosa sp.]MAR98379.1 ribosome silencing factor [Formosa sp.]|tara:strand:- start:4786 stop:5157 length:372 start_codon:yes stop_codon:yes gene_type:complete